METEQSADMYIEYFNTGRAGCVLVVYMGCHHITMEKGQLSARFCHSFSSQERPLFSATPIARCPSKNETDNKSWNNKFELYRSHRSIAQRWNIVDFIAANQNTLHHKIDQCNMIYVLWHLAFHETVLAQRIINGQIFYFSSLIAHHLLKRFNGGSF